MLLRFREIQVSLLFRKMASFVFSFVDIRKGERFKTFAMMVYFFLTLFLLYILKPVRGALFLEELGAKNLPYANMGEGIALVFVTAAYVYLAKKLPKKICFVGTLLFFASNLVLFWFLFHLQTKFRSAYFYLWVGSFSSLSTTQFWLLTNDLFNRQQAKRLFGLIISAGSAGGIAGGICTSQFMRWLKAEDMLLVASGVVMLCAFFLLSFWPGLTSRAASAGEPVTVQPSVKHSAGAQKLLLGSSYFLALAALVMLAKMSSTIIDNQFNRIVELHVIGKEARTAFLASFLVGLNGFSFIAQLFLTGLCLRALGVGKSLWILPIGLTLLGLGSVIFPVLGVGLILRTFDGGINYSIQQAGKEVLFLPIPSEVRYQVKPFIDMLGVRLSKTLSGVYILLMTSVFHVPYEQLAILVLILMPFWGTALWKLHRDYSKMLHQRTLDSFDLEKIAAPVPLT